MAALVDGCPTSVESGASAHRVETESEQHLGCRVGRHDDARGVVQDQPAVGVVDQEAVLLGKCSQLGG